MIKLETSYSLGSIIESNFLGISNDAVPENVIVTLSKNLVTCFDISGQKQVNGWNSSNKLSSGVIFDKLTNCYYGVFNYNRIGRWSPLSLTLKDMQTFTFTEKIMKLLTRVDYKEAVAVFENGYCEHLKDAFIIRKNKIKSIIDKGETIESAKLHILGSKAICIMVSVNSKNDKTLRSMPLESSLLPINLKISFKNETDKLLGYCIRENSDSISILTYWSDGFLYSNELYGKSNRNHFPGKKMKEIPFVNTKKQVTIIQLTSDCIGIYGSEYKGNGVAFVIHNFYYNRIIAVKYFKHYSCPPNVWCFGNNLLLVTGQNLAVLPFTREQNNLSLLMDNNIYNKNYVYEETKWDTNSKGKCNNITNSTSALPQSKLNEKIIADHIKNKNDKAMIKLLTENDDISDISLAEILSYCSLNTIQHSNLLVQLFAYPPLNIPSCLKDKIPSENMLNILNTLYAQVKGVIDEKFVDWVTLMIDCSYQHVLLAKIPGILELIIKMQEDIKSKCDYMDELNKINIKNQVMKSLQINTKK